MVRMKLIFLGFVILLTLIVGGGLALSEPNQESCEALKSYVEGLTDEMFGMPITNVTATWKKTGTDTYFCQVTGWIWPETKFHVTLPTINPSWNGRYMNTGGGGWDGFLMPPSSPNTLGYATSQANGGYMGANWPGTGTFGLKEPYFSMYYKKEDYPTGAGGWYGDVNPKGSGNPYACQKVYDFGIRHLRETPLIAKKIIKQYYGEEPAFSYFSGRSCGGKEGQISAQKLYDVYDGFLIGCPLGGHVAVTFRGTWDTLWGAGLAKSVPGGGTVYSRYKARLHYKAVYEKCDAVDGLVDGMIDDPRKCKFDPLTDLPACNDEEEAEEAKGNYQSTCFTLAQRIALKEIYAGPHDSKGNPWYVGTPLSAEYVTASGMSGFGSAISDAWAPPMFANIALDPPQGPYFDITTFDWDIDPIHIQETTCEQCYDDGTCVKFNVHDVLDGITLSPNPEPNMGGFEPLYKKGGKIVQFHGWADALVSAFGGSSQFYESVMKIMGAERTKSFYKLYMIPGAGHCSPGFGAYPNMSIQLVADWVEKGIEPGVLIGTRNPNVDANYPLKRTRPICPYPEVARYSGEGSIEEADNFMCVPPIEVRIEPETLNLKSKGEFTAFITVPEGYDIRDWNIGNISCEGAPAIKGMVSGDGRTYIAKFKRQDLKDVRAGEELTLTVKGTFTRNGKKALIQASDTIRVIN